MFGKASLLNKKCGGPKGWGEGMGAQTVMEGLIASTATMVSVTLVKLFVFYHSDATCIVTG